MSTALANPGDVQWLAAVPEQIRSQVAAQLAKAPAEIKRAMAYVTPDLLEGCTTADEAMEVLKATAEAILCDQQATYVPPVYTINHRTQRFQDDSGDTIKGPLRAVVLYFQPTRGFFVEGRKLPLCSAIGTFDKGRAAPDAAEAWSGYNLFTGIPIDWAGQEHDCANCPFNQFGSDPKTGAGKACKEKYRLFLALVDSNGQLTGEGVMLNVPTTSMKNWDGYVSRLRRYKNPNGKLEPKTTLHVVTEFELERAQGQGQDYAKITPKVARLLTGQEFRMVYDIRKQIVAVADTLDASYGESYDEQPVPGQPGPEYGDNGFSGDDDFPF